MIFVCHWSHQRRQFPGSVVRNTEGEGSEGQCASKFHCDPEEVWWLESQYSTDFRFNVVQ